MSVSKAPSLGQNKMQNEEADAAFPVHTQDGGPVVLNFYWSVAKNVWLRCHIAVCMGNLNAQCLFEAGHRYKS